MHKGIADMQKVKLFALALLTLAAVAGAGLLAAGQKEKPKYTIKEVMEKAHDGDDALVKKVIKGTADKKEKEQLLEMYVALGKNKPPKGSDADWKKKVDALIAAEKAVVENKEGATKSLQKAVTCKACHLAHKGD